MNPTSNNQNNELSAKTLLIFGDSIAQGNENQGISFATMVADRLSMKHEQYAVGGATVTRLEDRDNDIHHQIQSALDAKCDADYIIFNGMTNDIVTTRNVPLGEITTGYTNSFDEATFCGGFESFCRKLKLHWHHAKILYVRPHNMNSRTIERQIIYGEKALEICRKWSIAYVDLFSEGGLNTHLEVMNATYTINEDGTHPNTLGYELFYNTAVVAKILNI